MRKLILPMMLLAALGCAEPEADVAEVEPIETETEVEVVDPVPGDGGWWGYTEWDVDASQEITQAEFDERWEVEFAEWDVDGDGALGPDETAYMFWGFFDVNDDNIIDEQEWTLGTERWAFDDIDWGEWDTWDANADAELTETEWNEEWNSTVWPSWGVETDGVVGRDELADTFWDFFDANDDDIIDAGEWEPQG